MLQIVRRLPIIEDLVAVLDRRIGSCNCVGSEEGVKGDVQWEVEWRGRSLHVSSVSLWKLY